MNRQQANREILTRLSVFLQGSAELGRADVEMLAETYRLPRETAALTMLSACLGLDTEQAGDRMLEEEYLIPGFRLLEPSVYMQDAYRMQIRFPETQCGEWTFGERAVEAYEVFVRDDLLLTADGREIPCIGTFAERFVYPAVMQNGREWMTLAPVEIETMRRPVQAACGDVLTFGLGMGYYAFHASCKPEVHSLTIVERDPELIRMFSRIILPQFPDREKINIVQMDAYDYLEKCFSEKHFDSVFCDFWHDAGDGAEQYQRLKTYEKRYEQTFLYWAEGLIRQQLRLEAGGNVAVLD